MDLCSSAVNSMFLVFLSISATSNGQVALQKSVFNDNTPDRALDGNPRTCAVTGYDLGGWWKVDYGVPRLVKGVLMTASIDAFQVRCGNFSDALGLRGGFALNALCHFSLGIDGPTPRYLPCRNALVGRYLSVEVVDPVSARRLSLCDLQAQ